MHLATDGDDSPAQLTAVETTRSALPQRDHGAVLTKTHHNMRNISSWTLARLSRNPRIVSSCHITG